MSYKRFDITLYCQTEILNETDFAIRQNLVSDLYVSFLNNYKPKGTTRISVTLKDEYNIMEAGYYGSILIVYANFNDQEYRGSTSKEKNKLILDTIHRIALFCADKYNWDQSVFEVAYEQVIACNFVYKQELKRKFSKDRKHQAAILLEKNGKITTISVRFYSRNGDLIKYIQLLKSFHHDMFYGGIIKNNKWFDNSEFGIHARNEELVLKASIEKSISEIIITPCQNTTEELEGYLRRITYKELGDKSDYIKWANQ